MQVRLCGVRGSTPAPGADFARYGGHTSCLALSHDGEPAPRLILDAGTGLLGLSRQLGERPFVGSLLLSHLHWDHVLGLPFFVPPGREDYRLDVLMPAQEDGRDGASVLAGMMSPPYFPIGPTELRGHWRFDTLAPGACEVEGFSVLAREIPHKGGRTFGYRIGDGRTSIAYMPDHCPTVLGPGADGLGEYHPAAIELARDADLLVHDAQLVPAELAAEADFGHAVTDYSIELARRAGTRALVLFHHRHDRTDAALDALARDHDAASSPAVHVAVEGAVFEL